MKDLRGANAIVTGASRGIGPYIAKTLAARGVNLALAARSAEQLEETRRACETLGVRAIAVPTDVSSLDELRRLVDMARRELGPIDVLVNNAGIELTASLVDQSFAQVDAIVRTNLSGPTWLTKLVLPEMIERRRGVVVHVSSLAGKSGEPYGAVYSATKGALIAMSSALNMELDGTGVRCAAVCPGYVGEAGMWVTQGLDAPAMLKEVPAQKVADAVMKAIGGAPLSYVTSGPIRPLLALGELWPGLNLWITRRLGVIKMMRAQAERLQAGEDRRGRAAGGAQSEGGSHDA
jgi:short-subunit dehydrogenase